MVNRNTITATLLILCGVAATAAADTNRTATGWTIHGEDPGGGRYRPASKIVAQSDRYDGQFVRVKGVVEEVCKKKGCWMTLRVGDDTVRVTFKDYGFFVPKDIHGRRIRLEGVFSIREVPVDEARHYLEDAGRHEDAAKITEPQKSFSIEATGVRVSPS